MARTITISTSGELKHSIRTLSRIHRNIPKNTKDVMCKWGNILVRDTKNSALDSGIKAFSGTLYGNGIRWEQGKRSNVGYMFIRKYGIYLDSMKDHFVSVNRNRTRLLAWAKQSRSSAIRTKANKIEKGKLKSFSIFVKKHPFISKGYNRARPKLLPLVKRSIKNTIKII